MSLRDQLVAKGLVTKKDARRVEQQLREARKQAEGHKKSKRELEAEAAAARAAAEEAERQRKLAEKKARAAEREAKERALRLRQIIRRNTIRSAGRFRFYHRTLDGRHVHGLHVSERVAWKLRAGEAAIVADVEEGRDPQYVVVSARAAVKVGEIAPERVVHHVRDTRGLSAPEETLLAPDWDISLAPRRVAP